MRRALSIAVVILGVVGAGAATAQHFDGYSWDESGGTGVNNNWMALLPD